MSSSYSSEDENDMIYSSYKTSERVPWCPMLGQPLIYYAQIQPKRHKRIKEQKKNSPNCFVKAFQWYTQERVVKNRSSKNSNVQDFATWLDDKYVEFLQSGQTQCIVKETSTVGIMNSSYRQRGSVLRAKDLRKPLKVKRSNQSLKIILKPKNITRTTSDCCQRCKSRNYINGRTQSDTSVLEKKLKPKSQSLTSIIKEREIYMIPFEIVPDDKESMEAKPQSTPRLSKKDTMPVSKKRYKNNIACQCSHATFPKVDASSQMENKMSSSNVCWCDDIKPTALRKGEIGFKTYEDNKEESKRKTFTNNMNESVNTPCRNGGAQTSNYSVDLVQDIGNPILMKFMCTNACGKNKL